MRLTLMRHAATEANLAHRYEGARTDSPLCELGIEQCKRASVPTSASTHKVYASTMQRAQQTARLCFAHTQVTVVPLLEEFDFGVFEGRAAAQMENDEQYRAWVQSGCVAPCPGGDALYDYTARTAHAMEELLRAAFAHGDQEVVVVAHGGTIMAVLWELTAPEYARQSPFDWHAPNCGGYQAGVRVGDNGVELVNPRAFGLSR